MGDTNELSRIHERKIRGLVQANGQLSAKIRDLQRGDQENPRVKQIKNLRIYIRELEATNEALKKVALEQGDLSHAQLSELLDSAGNFPKRVRPPRPEKLQHEIKQAKLTRGRLTKDLAALQDQHAPDPVEAEDVSFTLSEQVEIREAEVLAKAEVLAVVRGIIQTLQVENSQLHGTRDKLRRCQERKQRAVTEGNNLREELLTTVANDEHVYQELRMLRSKMAQLSRASRASSAPLPGRPLEDQEDEDFFAAHRVQEEHRRSRAEALQREVELLQSELTTTQQVVQLYRQRLQPNGDPSNSMSLSSSSSSSSSEASAASTAATSSASSSTSLSAAETASLSSPSRSQFNSSSSLSITSPSEGGSSTSHGSAILNRSPSTSSASSTLNSRPRGSPSSANPASSSSASVSNSASQQSPSSKQSQSSSLSSSSLSSSQAASSSQVEDSAASAPAGTAESPPDAANGFEI